LLTPVARRILIGETSVPRGHRYVSNIVDADTRRLLFMCEESDSSTRAAFVKEMARDGADLKGGLWALRGNEWTRSPEQLKLRRHFCSAYRPLACAMGLRELLQNILAGEDADTLDWWCSRAMRSRLEPFKDLARIIRNHRAGIIAFLRTRVTNGLVEAINGLIQLAKRSARGFRSFKNFRLIALLKAGLLEFNLPHVLPT